METFTTKHSLQQYLAQRRAVVKTIGFVPTMGALHQGHLSLIAQAKELNDEAICSIFVNPTQSNDAEDLEKYPRPIVEDMEKLEAAGCDILFNPGVVEIYDANEQWHLNIGELEDLLEGKFRPGHYQGVTQVVYKLFNLINPDIAFFGQKDYQQFLVIKKMVELLNMPVKLKMCPIIREPDGLAMSSRNIHLTADDRQHALVLSKTLSWVKEHFDPNHIYALEKEAERLIGNEPGTQLEYFEIADGCTLQPADKNSTEIVALLAARVGNTRLIDNAILVDGR
ncbi:pantoate--beta-alanine ligase [soil metagenome]